VSFHERNLPVMRAALNHHNQTCRIPAKAILVNPPDFERLGIHDLWGLEVRPDDRVPENMFRIECEGSAWRIEDELFAYVSGADFATAS
jgi:hypothetical protein